MSVLKELESLVHENLSTILKLRFNKTLKSDNSYVSEGDLFVENLIITHLRRIYPEWGVVSEETPEKNPIEFKKENVIIVDPIDGTENFISGLKEWGVALCHYKNGKHQESLLMLPELDMSVKSGDVNLRLSSRIAGISSSLSREDILKLEPGFEYRIIGCCVYNMFNVITGRYASFENPKGASVWDIIPGLNLALENGLNVIVNNKEYAGELLDPTEKYTFKIW
jgi:myo-inositol-1(or 4)-monophosphatase